MSRDIGEFGGRLSRSFPSQIIVDVAEDCNLSCIHCASPQFRRSSHYSGALLSPELNQKLCEEVRRDGAGSVQYLRYAASGEPLLNPHLVEMLSVATASSGTKVALTTNGTLLDPEAARAILSTRLSLIDVSLDAARAETYSRIRVGGDLREVAANLLWLIELRDRDAPDTAIAVSFIEQAQNSGEVDEFRRMWTDAGVDHVVIRRAHSNGGAKRGLAALLHRANEGVERRACLYPWERVVLGPTGKLGFCPADWSHEATFADFRSVSIADVWQGEFMRDLRMAHRCNDYGDPRFSLCKGCPDWSATRWPSEGRSYADLMTELPENRNE